MPVKLIDNPMDAAKRAQQIVQSQGGAYAMDQFKANPSPEPPKPKG